MQLGVLSGKRQGQALHARWAGLVLLALVITLALAAPLVAPHDPGTEFRNCLHAPPMAVHVRTADGEWHSPFFYPLRLVSRLESKYEEIGSQPIGIFVPVVESARQSATSPAPLVCSAWLPLGADSYGRDVLARILHGARVSLGVTLVAVLGSILLGTIIGSVAGYFGGAIDDGLMRLTEFIVVLPTVYVVLALRAVMPLVLTAPQVFVLMAGIFAAVGWPWVARGVRGIVAAEAQRDYVLAARVVGAGHTRILFRHLLPATLGYLGTQATLLVPAFILAEATLSFVGLGFPDPTPTWGTMLQEATNVSTLGQFPWMLSPAVAVFVVVLAVNLAVDRSAVARPDGAIQPS